MLVLARRRTQRGGRSVFRDRIDAGDRLAQLMLERVRESALVLGIPRGGVVVAARVAVAIGAPLDVVVPRKLGAPGNPELGIGAVAPGVRVLHADLIARLRVTPEELERESVRQLDEVARRSAVYRGGRAEPELGGRAAVVVDDGVATGGTVLAAAAWARDRRAARVVLGVPVLPASILPQLHEAYDEIVCVHASRAFGSVGEWYEDFTQVSDEEVAAVLAAR